MSLSDHTMMPVGLDHVLALAVSIGDVRSIEAVENGGVGWTVRVRGEMKYHISFDSGGSGSTLDIACRECIVDLERKR